MGLKGKITPKNFNESERYLKISEIRIIDNNIVLTCLIYESKSKRDMGELNYIKKELIRINQVFEKGNNKKTNTLSILEDKPIYEACYDYVKYNVSWIEDAEEN